MKLDFKIVSCVYLILKILPKLTPTLVKLTCTRTWGLVAACDVQKVEFLVQSLAQFGLNDLLLSQTIHRHQSDVNNSQRLGDILVVATLYFGEKGT